MAQTKSRTIEKEQELGQSLLEKIQGKTKVTSIPSPELSSVNSSEIDKMLAERRDHRENMLKYVKGLTDKSFWLLCGIIVTQSFLRIFVDRNFVLIDSTTFNIIAVAVFGQIIGLIYVIVRSLWDDSKYLDKIK